MYGLTEELKPCPFCGGKVIFGHGIDGEVTGIMCRKCKAITRFYSDEYQLKNETFGDQMNRWAETWNRRTE